MSGWRKRKIMNKDYSGWLRAGSYEYTPYKFVRFEVNGIECEMYAPRVDRFALIEEQLGDMREAKEVIMKK